MKRYLVKLTKQQILDIFGHRNATFIYNSHTPVKIIPDEIVLTLNDNQVFDLELRDRKIQKRLSQEG